MGHHVGQQPRDPWLLVLTPWCQALPLSVGGTYNLLLTNGMPQRWVAIGLWLDYRSSWLLPCWLRWSKLPCWAGLPWTDVGVTSSQQSLRNSQTKRNWTLSRTEWTWKWSFLIEPSEEKPTLLTSGLRSSGRPWAEDPAKLRPDSWLTETLR